MYYVCTCLSCVWTRGGSFAVREPAPPGSNQNLNVGLGMEWIIELDEMHEWMEWIIELDEMNEWMNWISSADQLTQKRVKLRQN